MFLLKLILLVFSLFLRELEFQENVILLDDMNLKLPSQNSNKMNIDIAQRNSRSQICNDFYGKV